MSTYHTCKSGLGSHATRYGEERMELALPERWCEMIRVVYEWRVNAKHQTDFVAAWKKTTTAIRESVPGARGSTLLKRQDDEATYLSIARWDSKAKWQAFWKESMQSDMSRMHALGERIAVTVYDELGEFTV